MVTKSSVKTVIEAKGNEIFLTRVFDAPRELVFKAFSEPERISQWWGPRGWTLPYNKMDFRVGGVWHYGMRGPNGEESWGKTVYEEIVVPERIVYNDAFADKEGKVNESMPLSRTVMEFFDEGNGKTRIEGRSTYASAADVESLMSMGMGEGTSETFDRLAEYLAGAKA